MVCYLKRLLKQPSNFNKLFQKNLYLNNPVFSGEKKKKKHELQRSPSNAVSKHWRELEDKELFVS